MTPDTQHDNGVANRNAETECQNCGKTLEVPPEAVGEAYCDRECAEDDGLEVGHPSDFKEQKATYQEYREELLGGFK